MKRIARTLSLCLVALSTVGCGGSDRFVDEGGALTTLYLAPDEVATVRASRGTDVPSSTRVEDVTVDEALLEIVSVSGDTIEVRAVANGETTLGARVRLVEGSTEYAASPMDTALNVVISPAPERDRLVGTWRNTTQHNVAFWLELNADGTYTSVLDDDRTSEPIREGTWLLTGSRLVLSSADNADLGTTLRLRDNELDLARGGPGGRTLDYTMQSVTAD